jgi:hypothetical protein
VTRGELKGRSLKRKKSVSRTKETTMRGSEEKEEHRWVADSLCVIWPLILTRRAAHQ